MTERLTVAEAAARAGVKPSTWRGFVARHDAPPPDGRYDKRTPWWYATTVDAWLSSRPRRRTDSEETRDGRSQ